MPVAVPQYPEQADQPRRRLYLREWWQELRDEYMLPLAAIFGIASGLCILGMLLTSILVRAGVVWGAYGSWVNDKLLWGVMGFLALSIACGIIWAVYNREWPSEPEGPPA